MQKLVFSLCLLFVTFFINVNGQVIYRTDSIISNWPYTGDLIKNVYKYDQYGKMICNTAYYLNTDSTWVIGNKTELRYDERGKKIFRGEYNYIDNIWYLVYGYKTRYEYDENNNVTLWEHYTWDDSLSSLKIVYIDLYKYYIHNDTVSVTHGHLNGLDSIWNEDSKYDSIIRGNSTTAIGYYWNSENLSWTIGSKREYTFDIKHRTTSYISYSLNMEDSILEPNDKSENIYDENNLIQSTDFKWNSVDSVWEIYSKLAHTYTYDADNNILSDEYYRWNSATSVWELKSKRVSTYDNFGYITSDELGGSKEVYYYNDNYSTKERRKYLWKASYNNWIETDSPEIYYLSTYIYYPFTEYISANLYFPINSDTGYIPLTTTGSWTVSSDVPWLSFSPSSGTGKDTIYVTAQENLSGISRTGTITITCDSEFGLKGASTQTITVTQAGVYTTGIKEQTKSTVDLFPNPSTSYFKVRTEGVATVSVFSIKGELVLCTKVEDNQAISTEKLNKGMYLVKIENSDGTYTKRLVVK